MSLNMGTNPHTCIICGNPGVIKWTLSKGPEVYILDVCAEHEDSVLDLASKGRTQPAKKGGAAKGPKRNRFEPLDWTPPGS